MGKSSLCFRRRPGRQRTKKAAESPKHPTISLSPASNAAAGAGAAALVGGSIGKKRGGGGKTWMWMRFDRAGQSEILECEKSAILRRASIPARDFSVLGLGYVSSDSSNILARERAMVVNLEFIKAIVTAEEVLILDPLRQEVLPFVDQLRQQLPQNSAHETRECGTPAGDAETHLSVGGDQLASPEAVDGSQSELPFEFQVLEIALEVVCTYLDSNVEDLEKDAYPILDELARKVSQKGLEQVRTLKSSLTRLLSRVQKVKDEIEHLLDNDERMAGLYLTRKLMQNRHSEALLEGGGSNTVKSVVPTPTLRRNGSNWSGSLVTSNSQDDTDAEDVEMLLEAYFLQLDGTHNKIVSVKEYIEDTEDYVNIQLDSLRNKLISLQVILIASGLPIALVNDITGILAMNVPCPLYNYNNIFGYTVIASLVPGVFFLLYLLDYLRRRKLLVF